MKGKFYLKTYGCKLNKTDSIIIEGFLLSNGFTEAKNEDEADVIIINGCGVIGKTERREITEIRRIKEGGKKVVLGGCLPIISPKAVELADGAFSLKTINKAPMVVREAIAGRKLIILKSTFQKDKSSFFEFQEKDNKKNGVIKTIAISEGCLGDCAYCASKIARGRLKSFSKENILREIKKAVLAGKKEIQITSQGAAQYSYDIPGGKYNLAELIKDITKIEGDFMVRIGMMNPRFTKPLTNEIIEAYKNPKVYKFLHLPVQSGSDKILRAMNRGYRADDFVFIVEKFREAFPGLLLATDIIIGFPEETKSDFLKTVSLIKKVRPHIINITKYSPREGTRSALLRETVSPAEKNKRAAVIEKLSKEIRMADNKKFVGKEVEILLVDKKNNGTFLGRMNTFKAVVVRDNGKLKIGERIKVKITGYRVNYLSSQCRPSRCRHFRRAAY